MVVRVFFLVFQVRDSPFLVMVGRVDKTHGSDTHERLWTTLFTEISFLHEFQFVFLRVIAVDSICRGHVKHHFLPVGGGGNCSFAAFRTVNTVCGPH